MATNFIQNGETITWTNGTGSAVASGDIVAINALIGVALVDIPASASGGVGARVLAAITPVLAITVLLGFLAPAWTHPGYVETLIHFGAALHGGGVRPDHTDSVAAPATADRASK